MSEIRCLEDEMEEQEQTVADTEPAVVEAAEEPVSQQDTTTKAETGTGDSSISVTKDPDNVRTNILNRWPDESEKTDDLKAKLKGRD